MTTPAQPRPTRQQHLAALLAHLAAAAASLSAEWDKEDAAGAGGAGASRPALPSPRACAAERAMLAGAGRLVALVQDPRARINTLTVAHFAARALHVVVEAGVPALVPTGEGAAVEGLAARTGLDAGKLRRLLRTLVAHHVFVEVEHGRFAHNEASTVLAQDAGVRDWVLTSAMQFPAATHLPAVLRDERLGPSYSPADTAFARVHRTRGPFFAWLAGAEGRPRSPPPSSSSSSSPPRVGGMTVESEAPRIGARSWRDVFNVAMGGLSDTFYAGLEHDYPWGRVGEDGTGLVVDVGGGIGTSALQLHRLYPRLRLVVQDLPAMMAQAERYWAIEAPDALASGQARLMEQDFFDANAVVGAHVYWVRSVCHDWSDAQLAQILGNLAKAMGPHSRLLLGEMVMPTSCGDTAPAPVFASVFAHLADMAMMAVTNGQERTLAEYDAVVSAAGLRVVKVWPCRGLASVIECRKAAAAAAAAAA